ncbi:DUF927 domain-containing protein [Beijerinckia sp. L45]|uniref:DUF927 domain-containing protein n=1 Tax=Beijerinckia sp. L45 TaxID=1641855 RepID=UPI00131E7A3B|nr:DUF927 domain-containing protein [Beijerinckia sp. L45]
MKRKQYPFRHTANILNEVDGDAFEQFEFDTVNGKIGIIEVERSALRKPSLIFDRLLAKNVNISATADVPKEVLEEILSHPQLRLLRAAHTGWREGFRAFVAPTVTIVGRQRKTRIVPPHFGAASAFITVPRGSLEEWQRTVANPCCKHSSIASVALSAGFAAMLLKLVGHSSFGFNLHGPSKVGKSLCLLAASSISGAGRESGLSNWGDTSAAIEELAPRLADTLLPLNEVHLIRGAESGYYGVIKNAIYVLGEGRERRRHSASSFAKRDESLFACIFFSTAEHSFDYYAKCAGAARDDGELARCADISALMPGFETVVDQYPSGIDQTVWRDFAERLLSGIRQGCEHNHGVAMQPFVQYIMGDIEGRREEVMRYMNVFMSKLDNANLNAVWHHQAKNFAMVFAGGCMAVNAKILKLDKKRLLKILLRLFWQAHGNHAETRPSVEAAKRTLNDKLRSARIVDQRIAAPDRHDGFFTSDGARRKYTVKTAVFRRWFAKDRRVVASVLSWLHHENLLVISSSLKTGVSPLEDRTVRWPDNQPLRSWVFYDPTQT